MRSLCAGWSRPSRGIRTVTVLGALFLAALQAMTGYEIWRQHSVAITTAERNLGILADVLSGEIGRAVAAVDEVIDRTTLDMSVNPQADPAQSRRTMRERAAGIPAIFALMVVDDKGNALASLHSFSPRHQAFADSVRAATAGTGRPLHVGTVTPDPFDGTPVIPFARFRQDAAGGVNGLTIASMSVQFFQELLLQVRTLPGANLTLARNDGAILAQTQERDTTSLAEMPEFQPHAPDSGMIHGGGVGHGDRIVAFRTIRPYGLKLSVALQASDLLGSWRSNAVRLVLADLATSVLLVAALWLMLRGLRAEAGRDEIRREEERRLQMAQFALNTSADMVVWSDDTSKIIFANRAAHQRLGHDDGTLVGQHVADIDPAFPTAQWPRRMDDLRQAKTLRFDSTLRHRGGRDIPAEVVVSLFTWDGRDYTCAVIRDTIERKHTEAILAERTRLLEASNAELEQFAYVASHDLREPLRMVSSFVSLLGKRLAEHMDDEARDYVRFAQDGARRMDRLILDLLEYSRVGTESRPLQPLDLAEVAQAVERDLSLALRESDATLVVPDNLPRVWGDGDELTRLLGNLIGNALKYRDDTRPPRIDLGFEYQDGQVVLRVADNGIGIQPQYYDRIFRIFQRLHGREHYDGTGIGLAVCKKIVERHGGRIWVSSVPGQGTTFFFTLRPAPEA